MDKINFPHFTWPLMQGKQKQYNGLLPLHIPELEWLNHGKTMEEMLHASNAHLEHLFDNHTFCGEWCQCKKQLAEQQDG
eukprot:11709623-Ditylum_brightwellii.AAC.1